MPIQPIPWSDPDPPTHERISDRLLREGLRPSAWSNGPGDSYAVHSHSYHKVLYCVTGSLRFTLPDLGPDAGVDLTPGDRLELPSGTRHGALVGPQGCSCVEAAR